MFGCLRKLGCLFVILLGVAAYLSRGYWWRPAQAVVSRTTGVGTTPVDTASTWESLTPALAERGERQVRALAAPRGPVFVTLRGGELASYAFLSLSNALPIAGQDAQAAVIGDRVYVRSVVSVGDFSGPLGAIGSLIKERDTLRLGGTFEVVAPGRAAFHLQDAQIGSVAVPERLIPTLVRQVQRRSSRQSATPDVISIPIPPYIGDVRVGQGRITLYKRQ